MSAPGTRATPGSAPPAQPLTLDARVSVVIPCYTEKRWDQLVAAVESAQAQVPRPSSVILVVDYNDTLFDRASRELTGLTVLRNKLTRGVSGGRNTGALHTGTPVVVLLDDDATMRPGALARLMESFADPAVIGAGSAVSPCWEVPKPSWFPDEFLWVVTASYTGMPVQAAPTRNVWGACMAVRRDAFEAVGGFREDFARLDNAYRAEDTDLCLRMTGATGGGLWMYVPESVIDHPVPAYRTTFPYFLSRCYHEGRGKVGIARYNKGSQSLESERDYLCRIIPRAVWRGIANGVRGRDRWGIPRASAVIAGLAAAACGGLVEMTMHLVRRRRRAVEVRTSG